MELMELPELAELAELAQSKKSHLIPYSADRRQLRSSAVNDVFSSLPPRYSAR